MALNQPFLDGNRRSAWVTRVAFLWLNGLQLPDDALEPLADQVIAKHEQNDCSRADGGLSDWLHVRRGDQP
jgi:prophage maintenance system killer protein